MLESQYPSSTALSRMCAEEERRVSCNVFRRPCHEEREEHRYRGNVSAVSCSISTYTLSTACGSICFLFPAPGVRLSSAFVARSTVIRPTLQLKVACRGLLGATACVNHIFQKDA